MVEIGIFLAIFVALVIPMGIYMYHVASKKHTFMDCIMDHVDHVIYKVCNINCENMNWKKYALSLVIVNGFMLILAYLILRLQGFLFLNPNGISAMEETLSFNTIISFMTNTNLQHYAGESGLSYFSQMGVIIFMMFTSAASGYAACMAFIRGITGKELGNFYEDMVRITTRILIPFAFIIGLMLVFQGVPQTLMGNITVETVEGTYQNIPLGPVAALESIKHLGTNGGGFFGANSSMPFENPTVISNMIEMLSMMILPGACVVTFGLMAREKQTKGQGKVIFGAMSIIFLIGLGLCVWAENSGNPAMLNLGLDQTLGNMEGKEMRFGATQSALFTTVTTSFTTGSVDNMHDSLTPLGGLVPLLHMMLNCVFGGKGVGLMNMVMYVILAVFICGLMVGRTPEYLTKKIEAKEMKLVAIVILIHPLLILGFSGLALCMEDGLAGITNPSYHGLSQVLYEYASAAANNGSGFEGLADNSTFWNVTTGLVMFFGRYIAIVAQLAIAGSLLSKKSMNTSIGTLKTNNVTFMLILVFIVYIFAALTFFPALALGPIAEQLSMLI